MSAFSIRNHICDRRICRIAIESIESSPHQPRRSFDEGELRALADSIREIGLISPILVRRKNNGRFELIAGERRLRAMEILGWKHAEAIITEAFDQDCALIALIENLQREDLHFLDVGEACKRILKEHKLTQEELAASLCKSPSALANLLRILRLNRSVKNCIRQSGLSERHARALLRLENEEVQLELAHRAAREHLSVRQLEALIDQKDQKKQLPAKLAPGLIRDNRLVINALKDTVRQLRRIGVSASSRVETHEDHLDVIVTIRPPQE